MSDKKIENPFDFREDYSLNKIFDELLKIREENRKLKKKAKTIEGFSNTFEFMPLKSVDISEVDFYKMKFQCEDRWSGRCNTTKLKTVLEQTKQKILAEIEAVKDYNNNAGDHNSKVFSTIEGAMASLGIERTYTTWDYPNKRSRTKKTVTHESGWVADLRRKLPTSNVSLALSKLSSLEKSVAQFIQDEDKKNKEQKIEQDKKELEKIVLKHPDIFMVLKDIKKDVDLKKRLDERGHNSVSTVKADAVAECLDHILAQDKYLRLGHYLRRNRNDWNEGPDLAETGVNGFNPTCEEDHQIVAELTDLIQNWDNDGRCFRDCRFNYDYLFGLVTDKKLLEDLDKLMEFDDSY